MNHKTSNHKTVDSIKLLWVVSTSIATIFLFFIAFNRVSPGAGEEAVLIKKPMVFGRGGVHPVPVKTGSQWVAATTHAVIVPIVPHSFSEHFDDLMTSDGVPLGFDATIRIKVTNSVKLIADFGKNWYENNVGQQFRNLVRQSVRNYGLNETAINSNAIEAIDKEIFDKLHHYINEADLPLELISLTVGKASPPDAIKNQRIETASEQQRIITEKQKKLAEDQRRDSELSRAQADMAYRKEMQMNTEQFIQLENIKMLKDVCSKSECTFITGETNTVKMLK